MQFSGIYGLIPRLPLVLHEEEEGGHTSSAEIKLLLYGSFFLYTTLIPRLLQAFVLPYSGKLSREKTFANY